MAEAAHELPLHEEVLLLALRDEEGTTAAGGMYAYALGGAILAELLLRDRVRLEPVKKSDLVVVKTGTQTGERVLDEALDKIRTAKRRAAARTWVHRFAQTPRLKVRIAERLRQKGILKVAEDRVLWVFTRRVYPELDPAPERRIVERLRAAILSDDPPPDARTALLASLAAAASLLGGVLEKDERKARKARIKELAKGQVAGEATTAAIEAVQAAVIVATTTAVTIAATSAST
jgi:golgi phosphoprotein 3